MNNIPTLILKATEMAQLLLALKVKPGDTVIDATAGKGRDTCFLASLVKEQGKVWAFDKQKQACLLTQSSLIAQGLVEQVKVICDDHANIGDYPILAANAAIFNLGYLPGGDHQVISQPKSTVKALTAVFDALVANGIIVIVGYCGHDGGPEELAAVKNWYQKLSPDLAQIMEINYPIKNNAPCIIVVEKRGI